MPIFRAHVQRVGLVLPIIWFLSVEFLDELVDGFTGAAWPAIKGDLQLSLVHIGLLLGVPRLVGNIIEMPLGILADVSPRHRLIAAGGLAFAMAAALISVAPGFAVLMIALLLFNPASGAFVSISQASLMDMAPNQRELNMARWSLAGSLGNLAGPLLFSAAVVLGCGWRPVFGLIAVLALAAVAVMLGMARQRNGRAPALTPAGESESGASVGVAELLKKTWRKGALRWLLLLESSDLMLDVFRGYLALYLVEVVLASQAFAGLAVVTLTVAGLAGNLLIVPLLSRMAGSTWLRLSSLGLLAVFPAFLLVDALSIRLVLLVAIGLLTAGWYSVLKAALYAQLPGQSGTAMALATLGGLAGGFIPIILGVIAESFGLQTTMWLLLLAPVLLLL